MTEEWWQRGVSTWLNQKQVCPIVHGSVPFVHQQPHTPIDSVQPGALSGLGKGWAREPSHPSIALRGRGMITTECASVTVATIATEAASKATWARARSVTGAIIAERPGFYVSASPWHPRPFFM